MTTSRSDESPALCRWCAAGHPRDEQGEHIVPSTLVPGAKVKMPCTAPEEQRATGAYTLGVGGFSPADTEEMLTASIAALRMALPPSTGIALFFVDCETGVIAFKRDVQPEDTTLFYQALGAWAQATIAKDTRRG